MTRHEWNDRTADGEKRYLRGMIHAGRWTFETTLKSDPDWTQHDILPVEDLERLRLLMWKKYQRKRLPHGHIESIDKVIEDAREAEAEVATRLPADAEVTLAGRDEEE